jgi:hypothetical protein
VWLVHVSCLNLVLVSGSTAVAAAAAAAAFHGVLEALVQLVARHAMRCYPLGGLPLTSSSPCILSHVHCSFHNARATLACTSDFYVKRKPMCATINTLANALYKVFCYTGKRHLRAHALQGCYAKRMYDPSFCAACCCLERLDTKCSWRLGLFTKQ